MVGVEAVGAAGLGASGVWDYNRKNFLYDRYMRQQQEIKTMDMRIAQVDVWREDIRDICELTEKKMDVYGIVLALQIGFCLVLFTEGRLEQNTPGWLVWLFSLTLSGAFMYLLMAVWLGMHASVVAASSSVRILTQLVRPPIPSWEHIEAMRTYATSFEAVNTTSMFRIPIAQTVREGRQGGTGGLSGSSSAGSFVGAGGDPMFTPLGGTTVASSAAGGASAVSGMSAMSAGSCSSGAADPWGFERRGAATLPELARRPAPAQRHARIVREAAKHWQAYDAFARTSMCLGTILQCLAFSYYILGYVLTQNGAPWAAWSGIAVFLNTASLLLNLDVSMTTRECQLIQAAFFLGPALACVAAALWSTYFAWAQKAVWCLLPISFLSHAVFLTMFVRICHVAEQPNGALLPTSLRSVLYVDIYGWLKRNKHAKELFSWLHRFHHQHSHQLSSRDSFGGGSQHHRGAHHNHYYQYLNAGFPSEVSNTRQASHMSATPRRGGLGMHGASMLSPDRNLTPSSSAPSSAAAMAAAVASGVSPKLPLAGGALGADHGAIGRQTSGGADHFDEEALLSKRMECMHGQNFPRHFVRRGSPQALRPEDVDKCLTDPSDPQASVSALRAAAYAEHALGAEHAAARKSGQVRAPLMGIGTPGLIPGVSDATFDPTTFVPQIESNPQQQVVYNSESDDEIEGEMEAKMPVTGRDQIDPGRLPWLVFRGAAWLLTALWVLGALWSGAKLFGVGDVNAIALPREVSDREKPQGAQVSLSQGLTPEGIAALPLLDRGERILIEWPSESFEPWGMSCDSSGQHFAFSDEFQLYSAILTYNSYGRLKLTGLSPAPRCLSVEGQALRDIMVRCDEEAEEEFIRAGGDAKIPQSRGRDCWADVIYDQGRRLAECALSNSSNRSDRGPGPGPAAPGNIWNISSKWLRTSATTGPEEVIAITSDSSCDTRDEAEGRTCVVVGTNHGRVVRLRRHAYEPSELVPSSVVWNMLDKKAREEFKEVWATSLLQTIPGGCLLALRDGRRVLYAIHIETRKVLGRWRLPDTPGKVWTTLAGGGQNIFLGSQDESGRCELSSFPLPEALRESPYVGYNVPFPQWSNGEVHATPPSLQPLKPPLPLPAKGAERTAVA